MRPDLRAFVGSPGIGLLPDPPDGPADGTLLLDLGTDHPTRAGLIELHLWLDGEVISTADVVAGFVHRNVEKLFEVRDYRQILMLADRHDWQAPFASELTVALAVEDLLGLEVPPRAVWLRMALAEHSRIASHLGFLGWVGHRLTRPELSVAPLRERLRRQLLALTGNRVHPMMNRVGGVAADASTEWIDAELALADAAASLARAMKDAVGEIGELAGLATITADVVAGWGLSGPVARASGSLADVRRDASYLAYAELDLPVPQAESGDAATRLHMMADEITASTVLLHQIGDRLGAISGAIDVELPRVIKLPDAETYRATEAPLGHAGAYLVSRGQPTPWRLRLRTPSAANVAALAAILPGVPLHHLEAALASIGYVVGDVDK